jgi:hypothetical protein
VFSMGIGPSQTKSPSSELSCRAGYEGSIVRVLALILGGSVANGLGLYFQLRAGGEN